MNTDVNQIDQTIEELKKNRIAFVHSSLMWNQCSLPLVLQWKSVKFGPEERNIVPSDQPGIYAFMLEPNFAGPPKSAYLMYIGETTDSLRERYSRYLTRELKRFGRTIIGRMLTHGMNTFDFTTHP